MKLEDIQRYLPKYLSADSEKELFENLKLFPNNIDNRLYSNLNLNVRIIYQGDGIDGLLVINLPDKKVKSVPSMILSNTCDNYIDNKRYFSSRLLYAPIFNLNKYKNGLIKKKIYSVKQINDHLNTIKKQKVIQIFYLPKSNKLEESIIFFDRTNNCPVKFLATNKIKGNKLFILSDYGIWLFIFKLSVYFTRIREDVARG